MLSSVITLDVVVHYAPNFIFMKYMVHRTHCAHVRAHGAHACIAVSAYVRVRAAMRTRMSHAPVCAQCVLYIIYYVYMMFGA